MAKLDPAQERQRLADVYAGQLDGELEKVAEEAYELSDIARETLKAELDKRGLNVALAEHAPIPVKKTPKPGDPPEDDQEICPTQSKFRPNEFTSESVGMVMIRKFRDLPEALLAQGSLESAGIECAVADQNMVRLDWFVSNAIGGIKLLVHADEVADAEQVLSQPIPEHFDVSGVGEYNQPKCPKCGSLDINYRELDPAAYLSLAIRVPIPFRRRAWRCHSCNVEWEDDGLPSPADSST